MAKYQKKKLQKGQSFDLSLYYADYYPSKVVKGERWNAQIALTGQSLDGERVRFYLNPKAVASIFDAGLVTKEKTDDGYDFHVHGNPLIRISREGRSGYYNVETVSEGTAQNGGNGRQNVVAELTPRQFLDALTTTYLEAFKKADEIWDKAESSGGYKATNEDVRATAFSLFKSVIDRSKLFGLPSDDGDKGGGGDGYDELPAALEDEDDDLPF